MKNWNLPSHNSSLESLLNQYDSRESASRQNSSSITPVYDVHSPKGVLTTGSLIWFTFHFMKRNLCLLNEITMSWFQINFSPSALCIKIQPTMKRGTLIERSHPLPCKFATPEHLRQKGSQAAAATSISWGEHEWRSQSRAPGQHLKLELPQWYSWMIFSSGRGQTLVLIFLSTLEAFNAVGYNDIWFLAQLRMRGWLLAQILILERTLSMTSNRETFSHFFFISSFVVSHFNNCRQWLVSIQSNAVRWDAILPFFH